jgi:hypothetical protein
VVAEVLVRVAETVERLGLPHPVAEDSVSGVSGPLEVSSLVANGLRIMASSQTVLMARSRPSARLR